VPTHRRALTRASVAEVVAESFRPQPLPLCGIELEWPVHLRDDASERPTHDHLLAATAEPLPHAGRVTIEPGGQVELSTRPFTTADETLDAASADATALHAQLARVGLTTTDRAVDTRRAPRRILAASRYACMEDFFAYGGEAGTWMMCNTASLQVNLGHDPQDRYRRWALAHRLGPVLIAAFANSPGFDATGRRWESMRQGIWWAIDHGRTRPPTSRGCAGAAWLDYALAADVMLIRSPDGTGATALPPGFAFGRWLVDGHPLGHPTVDDLRYHLTTLFPPIRPRGWLELRMLDLLPPRLRDVATVVVLAALTTDATVDLEQRMPATEGLWCAAARHGMTHPDLADAARVLFDAVLPAMAQVTVDRQRLDDVAAFAELSVARGLSPAQLVPDVEIEAPFGPALGPAAAVDPVLAS
jgi:glutamate--cysteine ligase